MKNASAVFLSLSSLVCVPAFARDLPALTDVVVSDSREAESGKWNYILRASAQPWPCSENAPTPLCTEQVLIVVNESPQTLECNLHVDFKRADGALERSFDGPALVLPRTKPEVHSMVTDATTKAEVRQLSCHPRAPYKRVKKVEGCKYEMMGKPFESYYPPEAKRLAQQGPVIVSFLLDRREGAAKEIAVAEGSLVPSLDAAARQFIRDQTFVTNCPDTRFDILMRFKLRNELPAP
jgi:TonB family protein